MTALYILLAVAIALLITLIVIAVVKKTKIDSSAFDSTKNEINTTLRMNNEMTAKTFELSSKNVEDKLSALKDTNNAIEQRMVAFMQNVDSKLDAMRQENEKNLNEVRRDNETQLTKMRETVDEKLSSTLDERFNQSFKIISDRLSEINKGFMEMQSLQTGVNDLKKIFTNVKQRGTWGEIALDNLLSQILTPEQYSKNVNITKNENERVDFVINLPGKNEETVFLPIDAKFPIEDYLRLVEASEKGNAAQIEEEGKNLEKRIKAEAQSIRDKYVHPPKTCDFAILYLPVEGLYAEVVRRPNLIEDLQTRLRVVVCGPTTLAALLNSLQMGFRTVAIEKRSTEIGKLLEQFRKDFTQFSDLLGQTKKKLESVQNTIDNAEKRTQLIGKRLQSVSAITGEKTSLLEEASTFVDLDSDDGEN